jgi:hypothetical protein
MGSNSESQVMPSKLTGAQRIVNVTTACCSYVFYVRDDEQNPQGVVYQVPVLGGESKKLLADIQTLMTFLPTVNKLPSEGLRSTPTDLELCLLARRKATGARAR